MKTSFKGDCFSHIMKCEDHFNEHSVFMAGFAPKDNPRKSSMMAYGTIIDFAQLDIAWEKIKDDYSPDLWREMCKYWIFQHYLSPIPVLMVCAIYRKLGLKYKFDEKSNFVDLQD